MQINAYYQSQIQPNNINKKIQTTSNVYGNSCPQEIPKISWEYFKANHMPNITFRGNIVQKATNVELIAKMQELTTLKTFKTKDLNKYFLQMTQKAQDNVNNVVKQFAKYGLSFEKYLKACLKETGLFKQSPETIKNNIDKIIKTFKKDGLTTEKYLKACCSAPSLFAQSPETIGNNINKVVKTFEKDGLTTEKYLKACIDKPMLFYQSPETIEKNVKELIKKFKNDGLTTANYLKACCKQPSLFSQSPETIENNVREVVKIFEQDELSTEKYLNACCKQGTLFAMSPKTIEKNIRTVVRNFEQDKLTTRQYIETCTKQPTLFYQSPETITEHINAYKYCALHKNTNISVQDIIKSKNLTFSTSLIYLIEIIRPQITKQSAELSKLDTAGIKPELIKYFKQHPQASFNIEIPNTPMADNFIKTMQEWCKKEIEKDNAFLYHLV